MKFIEAEITAITKILEKGEVDFRDKGLDIRVEQLRSNVYGIENPELVEKFKALVNKKVEYTATGSTKEEKTSLQIRHISAQFKAYRELIHDYKTTTSFDGKEKGKILNNI